MLDANRCVGMEFSLYGRNRLWGSCLEQLSHTLSRGVHVYNPNQTQPHRSRESGLLGSLRDELLYSCMSAKHRSDPSPALSDHLTTGDCMGSCLRRLAIRGRCYLLGKCRRKGGRVGSGKDNATQGYSLT